MKASNNNKTQVLVLATLHKIHKKNKLYTYEDVFKIIDDFNPDVLGVEIRPEDLDLPREYLDTYYPYEMVETFFRWSRRIEVNGFDYYEKSVEGRHVPEGYFNNFFLRELENKYDNDASVAKERELLEICSNKRNEFFNEDITAAEINDGRYDVVCDIFYKQLEYSVKDTVYKPMSDFYRERDKKISENIVNIIEKNMGKKLLFVLGCDHRGFAVSAIKEHFNDSVEIVKVR